MLAHALGIAVQTCIFVEGEGVGTERLKNFNKSFRESEVFIKITRMSQRISLMIIIMIMIIIIINRELRAFAELANS
jgi:hypothetical protein